MNALGAEYAARCTACRGTGEQRIRCYVVPCPACHGRGRLKVRDLAVSALPSTSPPNQGAKGGDKNLKLLAFFCLFMACASEGVPAALPPAPDAGSDVVALAPHRGVAASLSVDALAPDTRPATVPDVQPAEVSVDVLPPPDLGRDLLPADLGRDLSPFSLAGLPECVQPDGGMRDNVACGAPRSGSYSQCYTPAGTFPANYPCAARGDPAHGTVTVVYVASCAECPL